MKQVICLVLCCALFFATINCGTFMYPERKGQQSGPIDAKVVLGDVLWCFCFIIPGIIAFYLDIDNGCIYKPYGSADASQPMDAQLAQVATDVQVVFFDINGNQIGDALKLDVDANGRILNIQEWRERSKLSHSVQLYYNGQLIEQPSC